MGQDNGNGRDRDNDEAAREKGGWRAVLARQSQARRTRLATLVQDATDAKSGAPGASKQRERHLTRAGFARTALIAVGLGVALCVLVGLITLAVGVIGGGWLRGLEQTSRVLMALGAIMLIVGAMGLASPGHFGEAGAHVGRDIGERFGIGGRDDGLTWCTQTLIAAVVVEAIGIALDVLTLHLFA